MNSHSVVVGYILWTFGFMGAHRFYFGKQISGVIWFFTLGFFLIGWLADLFLIASMDRDADLKYQDGRLNHPLAWILLTFLGFFGVHRLYMSKWISGILFLCTGAFLGIGWLWDLITLNEPVSEINLQD